jgi:hypothetical protein
MTQSTTPTTTPQAEQLYTASAQLCPFWAECSEPERKAIVQHLQARQADTPITVDEYWGEMGPMGRDELLETLADDGIAVEESAPTHTVEEYQAMLAKWDKTVASEAERNYVKAQIALETVLVHQGSKPGKAYRSTAVFELAKRQLEANGDHLYPPPGKTPEAHYKACSDAAKREVLKLIKVGATLRLLYGVSVDAPVVCTDYTPRKSGTKQHPAIAWNRVRELMPLSWQRKPDDETTETWELLPLVSEDAVHLAKELMEWKTEDVVRQVREIALLSAQKRLELGDKSAAGDVEHWGVKVDASKAKAKAEKPEPKATEPKADTHAADVEEPIGDPTPDPKAKEPKATTVASVRPKDEPEDTAAVAACIAEMFAEAEEPDTLLSELLRRLKAAGCLSAPYVRAVDAALLLVERAEKAEMANA